MILRVSRSVGRGSLCFAIQQLAAIVAVACCVAPATARAADAAASSADATAESGGAELPSVKLARFSEDPAALAPIGIVSGTTLKAFDWAFSYRYSIIHHDDMRRGSSRKSTSQVLAQFDETPRKRDLHVHRLGVSFAPHDRITLAVGVPILTQKTRMITRSGETYSQNTEGIGDLEIRALVPFMRNGGQTLQVEMGLTAPTGDTGQSGRNGFGAKQRLPFPQQLGTGTVDLLPGIVYRGFNDDLSWGLVGRGVFRVYHNSKSYREGDHYSVAPWIAHSWTEWVSTSFRIQWEKWQNISGTSRANQTNPERDPKRQGGNILEIGPGVNFKLPFDRAPRLGVEMAWPVWQKLNGPQVERDWRLTAGWRWEF